MYYHSEKEAIIVAFHVVMPRVKTWKLDFNHDNEQFENWNLVSFSKHIPKTIEVEQSQLQRAEEEKNCCNIECYHANGPLVHRLLPFFQMIVIMHIAYFLSENWTAKSSSFNCFVAYCK